MILEIFCERFHFAHSVCIPHHRRDHTVSSRTFYVSFHDILRLDHDVATHWRHNRQHQFLSTHLVLLDHAASLAADASFALLAASAWLLVSSGPSWAAATIVATDGCPPADETRCRSFHLSHTPLRCRARSLCQRLNRQICFWATLEFAAVTPSDIRITVILLMHISDPYEQSNVVSPGVPLFSDPRLLEGGTPPIGCSPRPIPMVQQLACYGPPFDWSLPPNHPVIRQSGACPPFDRSLRSNLPDSPGLTQPLEAMSGPPELPQLLRPMLLARVVPPVAHLSCSDALSALLAMRSGHLVSAATRHPSQSLESPHFASSTPRLIRNQRALSSLSSWSERSLEHSPRKLRSLVRPATSHPSQLACV